MGTAIFRLRDIARWRDLSTAPDGALGALAQGQSATAVARLTWLDQLLAAHSDLGAEALQMRSLILAISAAGEKTDDTDLFLIVPAITV